MITSVLHHICSGQFAKQDDVLSNHKNNTVLLCECMSKVGFQSDICTAYIKVIIIYNLFKSFHQILIFCVYFWCMSITSLVLFPLIFNKIDDICYKDGNNHKDV